MEIPEGSSGEHTGDENTENNDHFTFAKYQKYDCDVNKRIPYSIIFILCFF